MEPKFNTHDIVKDKDGFEGRIYSSEFLGNTFCYDVVFDGGHAIRWEYDLILIRKYYNRTICTYSDPHPFTNSDIVVYTDELRGYHDRFICRKHYDEHILKYYPDSAMAKHINKFGTSAL